MHFTFRALQVLTFFLIVGYSTGCTIVIIDEKERGVLFERYNGGIDPDIIYGPGLQIFPIMDHAIIYNIDTLTQSESSIYTTLDNVDFRVDLQLSYKVVPDRIGYIENSIGRDYYNLVVFPEVDRALSNYFAMRSSNDIELQEIDDWEAELLNTVLQPIRENYIDMIRIQILDVERMD